MTSEGIDPATVTAMVDEAVPGWKLQAPTWAAAVFDRSGIIAYSATSLDGFTAPARSDVFRIASMSKSFLVACLLLLVERGELDLDTPVGQYIPSFRNLSGEVVTVKMIISNCSGLPEDNAWSDRNLDIPRGEFVSLLQRGLHFSEPPGQAYQYSNIAFTIASMILEVITSEHYESFLKRELLHPLGLDDTRYRAGDYDDRFSLARGFTTFDKGRNWIEREMSESGATAPIGALFSTVDNIARWSGWLSEPFEMAGFGGGQDGEPRVSVLSGSSRARMQRIHTVIPSVSNRWVPGRNDAVGYGLGLMIEHDSRFGPIAQHSGGLPGYAANMRWHLDSGIGVVAYATADGQPVASRAADLLDSVLRRLDVPARRIRMWPATYQAARRIDAMLLSGGNHLKIADMLSANVFYDVPADIRRSQLRDAVAGAGGLAEEVPALSSRLLWCASASQLVWRLPCKDRDLQVRIELSDVDRQPVQRIVVEPLEAELDGLPDGTDLVVRHHLPLPS
ncbi:serine hydrolase domain-containing protein [Acidipropionibacterium jensenii]|uniref:serine hydrolase domain-containing protein n=1 Tax=Acidipropionibacterium jensenii TaxID=1749 RepID=UPI00214C643A|nr:serine hydrolase domain-containing protein [Acidipropionibacterium jensenii]